MLFSTATHRKRPQERKRVPSVGEYASPSGSVPTYWKVFLKMFISSKYLQLAIRSGDVFCTCPEGIHAGPVLMHLQGCRWDVFVHNIYGHERRDEASGKSPMTSAETYEAITSWPKGFIRYEPNDP